MRTRNIPFFNMKKKKTLNYSKSAAMGFYSNRLKNEFERAVVSEPSVFEPLKFYRILRRMRCLILVYTVYSVVSFRYQGFYGNMSYRNVI